MSRTTYAALFAVIGVTWGVGNGTTTFNVPDLQGRMVIGAGSGSGLTVRSIAQSGGEETHVLTVSEIPAHAHNVTYANHGADNASRQVPCVGTGSSGADFTGQKAGNDTGGDGAHQNMPPYKVLLYIIKQ